MRPTVTSDKAAPGQKRALYLACALATIATSPHAETMLAANEATLQTVIVTADKLGRSLQDTPASVVVLKAEELERRAGATTTRDVLANIPNIVYTGTGNIAPTVRGVDSTGASQGVDAFIAGSRARLNMQIDGRPASYNEIVFGDSALWDVQQVEVLRGAQSTLQGRNAISGTIATKTKDPTFTTEGAVRLAITTRSAPRRS